MNPGRELDALIAEKVMGISKEYINEWLKSGAHESPYISRFDMLPHYSTDIRAAWEVVEKLQSEGWDIQICTFNKPTKEFGITIIPTNVIEKGCHTEVLVSDSAPHAICLAALKAVEGK